VAKGCERMSEDANGCEGMLEEAEGCEKREAKGCERMSEAYKRASGSGVQFSSFATVVLSTSNGGERPIKRRKL